MAENPRIRRDPVGCGILLSGRCHTDANHHGSRLLRKASGLSPELGKRWLAPQGLLQFKLQAIERTLSPGVLQQDITSLCWDSCCLRELALFQDPLYQLETRFRAPCTPFCGAWYHPCNSQVLVFRLSGAALSSTVAGQWQVHSGGWKT